MVFNVSDLNKLGSMFWNISSPVEYLAMWVIAFYWEGNGAIPSHRPLKASKSQKNLQLFVHTNNYHRTNEMNHFEFSTIGTVTASSSKKPYPRAL